jgi:hypothetical protein
MTGLEGRISKININFNLKDRKTYLLGPMHQWLQCSHLCGLAGFIDQHRVKVAASQAAEHVPARGGKGGEHKLCVLHEGQLQLFTCLEANKIRSCREVDV